MCTNVKIVLKIRRSSFWIVNYDNVLREILAWFLFTHARYTCEREAFRYKDQSAKRRNRKGK